MEKLDLNKLAASGLATTLNEQMFSLYRRLGESKDLIAFFLQYKGRIKPMHGERREFI